MAMTTPGPVRAFESHLARFRAVMRSQILEAFVQPMFYFVGLGVGVGALVDARAGSAVTFRGLSYFQFFAPSVMATSAMMLSAAASLWPVMSGFTWQRYFFAQHDAPLSPTDVLTGKLMFDAFRSAISATGVAVVLAVPASTRSWGLIPAVAAAVLTGLAFATPITAWSATRTREYSFPAVMRFIITPLFLFGGAFYPVSQLPGWMQPVAVATPIWHGIQLCRGLVYGTVGPLAALGHVTYLSVFVVVGFVLAQRTFRRRLAQ